MMRVLLFLAVASIVKAQFNQRWTWQNVLNANGQPQTKALWRPDNSPNTPYSEVIIPSGPIQLE